MKNHFKKGAEMGKYSSYVKEEHIRQNIVLADHLHKLAKEISFREKTRLTEFVRDSLVSFLDGKSEITPMVEDNKDVVEIHTCINLPVKLVQNMKSVAHYQNVMLKDILKLALMAHLGEFSEKYPDIIPAQKNQ